MKTTKKMDKISALLTEREYHEKVLAAVKSIIATSKLCRMPTFLLERHVSVLLKKQARISKKLQKIVR